jgi:serine/threonine-protein kinase
MGWNDLIGRRIGPYEIVEELGRGGSARVYRAHQDSPQRTVAIKVLLNDAEDRLGFVRRFARELEAVAHLHHPNIVEVYEAGEVEDLVYLVMQCVNGGTLRQRLDRPLPIGEACVAVSQVAQALHHAHMRGIVHRDVKPSNMLIDSDHNERVLLTDFGIAKLAGMGGLTKSGTTIGTPEYMAPEQAEGREIDARADVYSLGCVLYEALAGRAPFVGSAPVSVLYQHVHVKPDYIRLHNPEVPRELAAIVEQALAKQPSQRFASAESLAQALLPFTAARQPERLNPWLSGSLVRPDDLVQGLDLRTGARDGAFDSFGAASPPPLGYGEQAGQIPRVANTPGLGAEGLDALFPDDPEAQASRAQSTAGPRPGTYPGYLPGQSLLTGAPPVGPLVPEQAGPRPTIPLAAWPQHMQQDGTALALPLTPEGQLDMHALMSQVPPVPPEDLQPLEPVGWSPPPDLPPYEQWSSSEEVTPYTAWDALPAEGNFETWDDEEEYPLPASYALEADNVPSIWGDMHKPAAIATLDPVAPPPIWRPEEVDAPRLRLKRRKLPARDPRALAGISLAVVLALALMTWAVVSALGVGVAHGVSRMPTATVLPTATSAPAPTATLTQQQVQNTRAAAAMRGVTVTTQQVAACVPPESATTFSRADAIWVNVCLSELAPSAPLNVALEQGAAVVTTIATITALPGHAYHWAYYASNLAPGSYHMVVTFNGGTAADLPLTVQ